MSLRKLTPVSRLLIKGNILHLPFLSFKRHINCWSHSFNFTSALSILSSKSSPISFYPTRKVVPGGELLSSAVVPRKVRMLKTASPGRCSASHVSAFRSALSGCTVSVCREVYTNHRRTSSSFFKNFVFFCNNFSKILKNQRFQKSHFCHFFTFPPISLHFSVLSLPCSTDFSTVQTCPTHVGKTTSA